MSESKKPKSYWFLKSLSVATLILLDLFLFKVFIWPLGADLVTELKNSLGVKNTDAVTKSPWLVESPGIEIVSDWKSISTDSINENLDYGEKTRIRYIKIKGDLVMQILTTVRFPNTSGLFSLENQLELETDDEENDQTPSWP